MSSQYTERDIMELDRQGGHYSRHVNAMTGEGLHDKSDIAAELAYRDSLISDLCDALEHVLIGNDLEASDECQVKAALVKARGKIE